MNQIKLIALDMDGTLLNTKKQITHGNVAAIKKAQEAGFIVTFATGRMFRAAQHYATDLGLDIPLVVYNGARIQESVSEKVLGDWPLDRETANGVINYCHSHGIYVQTYIHDRLWTFKDCPEVRAYSSLEGVPYEVKGDEMLNLQDNPHKLLVVSTQFYEVKAQIEKLFPGKIVLTSSAENFIEVMEPGITKWRAIEMLAAKLGISQPEIMCVGDSDNDVNMLENAGVGVAMGNATDEIKDKVKIITGDNEHDGVAMILNQVVAKQIRVPENY